MTKEELIAQMANSAGITKVAATVALEAFTGALESLMTRWCRFDPQQRRAALGHVTRHRHATPRDVHAERLLAVLGARGVVAQRLRRVGLVGGRLGGAHGHARRAAWVCAGVGFAVGPDGPAPSTSQRGCATRGRVLSELERDGSTPTEYR